MPPAAKVRPIEAAQTIPLRHAILRPGRPVESAQFPGDDRPDTCHFGAFQNDQLLSVASLYLADMPGKPGVRAYQLRGMATAPAARGTGLGRLLIDGCLAFARDNQAEILWCNARLTAAGFYKKMGFEINGAEFEIPDVGPHYVMWIKTAGRARCP